ncbi:cyclodeaminase/cyclohydrolase family protein [Olsenella massiliensis]|uniref:cyclodeaminase/cyclohydrolase family protein n=1 Tax=Olsenella massiliensis TaxID=1622075 RepID=UPI000AB0EC5B|nr:cyclodeaminase/cyclohydrolase family protein [Olsenella massiliensis]
MSTERGSSPEREPLTTRTIDGFSRALAAKVPVPGGGGAAAYAGALSAALAAMVANYTVGKRRYREHEDDVRRVLLEAERLRERLVLLVDEDAAAFEPLSAAYGIPKEDPSRDAVLDRAVQGALLCPLEMMRAAAAVIPLLEELAEKGSVLLVSDVGCGTILARAALESAALNVLVNTRALRDRARAAEVEKECDELLGTWVPRAQSVSRLVFSRLRERG